MEKYNEGKKPWFQSVAFFRFQKCSGFECIFVEM